MIDSETPGRDPGTSFLFYASLQVFGMHDEAGNGCFDQVGKVVFPESHQAGVELGESRSPHPVLCSFPHTTSTLL